MEQISVALGQGYEVHIGRGLLDKLGSLTAQISKAQKAAVISDDRVWPLYGPRAEDSLRRAGFEPVHFVFPNGEGSKNLSTYGRILNFLAENRLSRTDLAVALGGGVTGDLAGFAAATYLRGIPVVQVPTTLLAAVDSSVGGKTGVDLPAGKNLAGCFCQPALVVCDPDCFRTLEPQTFRDGCAEVIKYGLLGDRDFFESLERIPAERQIKAVVAHCVRMKRDIVQQDERDTGLRRLLNLGHSFGHGVEQCSGYRITHGSAVAMGMAAICRAGVQMGVCSREVSTRVEKILKQYGLPTQLPYGAEELAEAMKRDKKVAGGRLHLVVPEDIGRCRICPVALEELEPWLRAGGAR